MATSRRLVSDLYPYLPLHVSIRSWRGEAVALLDTGFSDQLVVPSSVLEDEPALAGDPDTWVNLKVADGRSIGVPLFHGTIELPNLLSVEGASIVVMGDQYILGRGILDLYKITLDHGRQLIIEP